MREDLPLSGTLLLVDDQSENVAVLMKMLQPTDGDVLIAQDGETALELARRYAPELILLDVNMPGMDGFEVCRRLQSEAQTRDIPIIFLTARSDSDDVVEGFRLGGVDYIVKPFNQEELLQRVRTQLRLHAAMNKLQEQYDLLLEETSRREALTRERDHLADRLSLVSEEEAARWGLKGFVGRSTTLQTILKDIDRLQQAATTSVLIHGESGTGKELIARAIHFGSTRAAGPFVPVNCSAIPHELSDSLFFGHVKGAFTGADKNRTGYFELAEGGTLFLDELGEMRLDLQAKLLRVLEERKVMPVGDDKEIPVDVRVLAATNVDLEAAIGAGQFRQDLYYRLAGFPVHVPPLRERQEDIPLLAEHFLQLFAAEMRRPVPEIGDEAIAALKGYAFPGNIRELKNVIERALIESDGGTIAAAHLHLAPRGTAAPAEPTATAPASAVPLSLKEAEQAAVQHAMAYADGNISEAARLLGITRARLYRKLDGAEGESPSS